MLPGAGRGRDGLRRRPGGAANRAPAMPRAPQALPMFQNDVTWFFSTPVRVFRQAEGCQ
jgi:hypothetical protein